MSGTLDAPPHLFTIGDGAGMTLTVMDIGAAWLSCRVPLDDGSQREVLLGHAAPADYLREPGYLGAIVGRYANSIANARFALDGRMHELTPNEGPHQLHGGPDGFHRRRWAVADRGPHHVRLSLVSPAGDQGFPGMLRAEVEYRATARTVTITFDSDVSEPCPVNVASHAYFNLDGMRGDARGHRIRIAASRYLPVDRALIPTGEVAAAEGTPFDLRAPCTIGAALGHGAQQRLAGGYDHCFVLDMGATDAAELRSSDGRLTMALSTSYPGLQFYSGQHLAQAHGRDGRAFAPFAGVALEPQYFPDSPNRPHWPQPDCVLRPGERRRHFVRYSFGAAGL